jgi:hypothetical protein
MYKIVRMYQNESSRHYRRTIESGLTLEEAQAHCQDIETSSSTCTRSDRKRITAQRGPWFDSYQET